jgi:hypothetical protein
MHKEHTKEATQHQADVEKHGDEAMGFPHDKTSHHFHLYSDGGAIEVTVNDSKNSQNVQAIRSHLRAMARIAWVSSSRLVHLQPAVVLPPAVERLDRGTGEGERKVEAADLGCGVVFPLAMLTFDLPQHRHDLLWLVTS